MNKKIYAFIGLPASGKGTQAMKFAEKNSFVHISIGDLVRETIKGDQNDPIVKRVVKLYSEGKPVDDDIVIDLIEEATKDIKTGIVFDNFPFTENQAKKLDEFAEENLYINPKIIYIEITPESAIARISKRKVCPDCKSIYNNSEIVCPKCGATLIVRSDDNEETVRKRIEEYYPRIKTIVDIYSKKDSVIKINGEQSIEDVSKEIEEKI